MFWSESLILGGFLPPLSLLPFGRYLVKRWTKGVNERYELFQLVGDFGLSNLGYFVGVLATKVFLYLRTLKY